MQRVDCYVVELDVEGSSKMGFEGSFSVSRWERQRALADVSRQPNSSLLALQRQQICLFDHDRKLSDQSPRTCITAPLPPKLIPAFPRRHVSLPLLVVVPPQWELALGHLLE